MATIVFNSVVALAGLLLLSCLFTLPQVNCEEIEPEAVPVCPTIDAYIPHENCTRYYQCVDFVPFERMCSGEGSLFWNPRKNECDYPFNVPECVGGTRPPIGEPEPTTEMMTRPTTEPVDPTTLPEQPTTNPPPTPDPSICEDPTSAYYIPDENDDTCRNYIFCFYGVPLPLYCAPDLVFDPSEQKCVRPESYECPARQTTTTTTTPPPVDLSTTEVTYPDLTTVAQPESTTTDLFPCPNDPFIYVPHYESCHLFYLCINGEFRGILDCGEDHWFDSASQGCVPPEHSDCAL